MPDLHSLPAGSWPEAAVRNNGSDDLALQRYKLRELAEGWPCYRDACEWENFESIFHPSAHVYTTWSGRVHYRDFINMSQVGMDKGAFIMHRVHGSTTDINTTATRAVTKMKATITQRFTLPCSNPKYSTCEADAESDCRFCFFWIRDPETQAWQARYVRHWYEKDKLIPVDPRKVPEIDDEKLAEFPPGYRYLGYCQETTLKVRVKMDLPGHRREDSESVNRKAHDKLYWQCKKWVEGEDLEI